MLFTKPPFPITKSAVSPPEEDAAPPSYPTTSTSAPQRSVHLEDIFDSVANELAGATPGPIPVTIHPVVISPPPTPNPMPDVLSIDTDTEDEAADAAVDLHRIAADFVTHYIPNTLPTRLQRDRQLQGRRLKHLDPEVLTAAIWGAYKTITAILNDRVDEGEEDDFRTTCQQLLPFFSALSKKMKMQGFCQIVHIPASFEHVDQEADFVVLTGRDYLERQQRIKAKCKAMTLSKMHGYSQPDHIDREDLLMAHEIHASIRLTIGGGTSIPAPFPAHVLRDVPAVQRFTEIALPGTFFLDQVPSEVEITRILYGVCRGCAGLHPDGGGDCRTAKKQERRSFSPTYETKLASSGTYYVPPFLLDDFDLHVIHYELVYPGACFLFGRVPPAIADARANFRLCPDCGLSHRISLNSPPFTMLPTPASLLCPYNTRLLAEKFVREFHQMESYSAKPSIPYASGRLFARD